MIDFSNPSLTREVVAIAVALGIGLLIGLERERRKGEGPGRSPAGLRTFTAASLAGAISVMIGGKGLLAVVTAGIMVLTAIAYLRSRSDDPGLTSETALILTVLLGGLATQRAVLAAGVAVILAILLAARAALHDFVRSVLSDREVKDGLIFAAATLVVLPLLPDQPMGPYGALNPRAIWIIVILVMAIGAAGHVSIRLLGARGGLAISGFASGFVSSTATIGAMGTRARKAPELLGAATAGATLSTVATIVQLLAVLAATSLSTLQSLLVPLLCAGAAAAIYGAIFTIKGMRETGAAEVQLGHAFSLASALLLALTLSGVLLLSAALREAFGEIGLVVSAAVAGLADTHSPAVAAATLAASGKINPADAAAPVLAALSTNTLSKIVVGWVSGGRSFALRLIPGLIIVIAAAWTGSFLIS
ncbi:MgtC/SapB family protein [Bradyrhizobium sp. 1050_B9_N1_2]|uniref:MgtC/SapB family protein n=1 Tax=Bradyrhizobium sp. 1050_B9_N1_2 TaxID=3238688 RepID=UPI003EDC3CFF